MDLQTSDSTSNHIFIVYVIGFAVLSSVAMWDLNCIVTDYIYDNRLTIVKQVDIDGKFPYLGQTVICLTYDCPLFPGPPIRSEDFRLMAKDYWSENPIQWLENMTEVDEIMAKHMFDIIMAYSMISCLDKWGPDDFEACSNAESFLSNRSKIDEVMDKFIADPDV